MWVIGPNMHIVALNLAVPKQYKQANSIGMANCKMNQSIMDVIGGICNTYGVPTPDEVTANEENFARGEEEQ